MSDEGHARKFWDIPAGMPKGAWAEKRRLAAAVRELIGLCVTTDAPEGAIATARAGAEAALAALRAHPGRTFREAVGSLSGKEAFAAFADRSVLVGLSNPIAPPLALAIEKDGDAEIAVGTLAFGAAFEGVPGCVHGGMIAAAFDQVFGYLQTQQDVGSLTASLTIEYRRPTPILVDLRIEARVVGVSGRKSNVVARMLAGETITAEAKAVFVAMDATRMNAVFEAHARSANPVARGE